MRRAAFPILLALCALWGCADRAADRLERSFDEATLALRRGALADAQRLVQDALHDLASASPTLPESVRVWQFRLLRAEILLSGLDEPGARGDLASPIPEGAEFDEVRTRQAYLRARADVVQNKLPDALATLDRLESALARHPAVRADADVLAGQIRFRLGRFDDAQAGLQAAAARAAAAGDRYREALALNNLGRGLIARGRWDQALTPLERLLTFTDLDGLSVHSLALNNAGICYARLGQFEQARALQERAVKASERTGRVSDVQQALGELGATHLLEGDAASALEYFERALDIAKSANLRGDAALWARNTAVAHMQLANWDEAERFNDEAERLAPSTAGSRSAWPTLYKGWIAAGRERHEDAQRLFEEALSASAAEPNIRWGAYDGLAGVAMERNDMASARRHFEAALQTIESMRASLQQADSRLSFHTRLFRFYRGYVQMLIGAGDVVKALEVADSSRGRVLAERHGVPAPSRGRAAAFQDIARRSQSVLVSYWLAPHRSYVWVVTAAGIRMRELAPAAEIEQLVARHQSTIIEGLADPLAATDTAGDRLYKALVEPISTLIPANASVVVIPDGALHRLNLETLPVDGVRRHYWIEDAHVQTAPSLALLETAAHQADTAASLLLVGDPTSREPEFPTLRYASAEMNGIASHFPRDAVTAFQGAAASPGAYRDARPERFRFVHFTAHAAANAESPLDSAVILSGADNAHKLYARDIAEGRLHAQLVTISACRSAGERAYSGEGLVGFAWAFLRAGAKRVIAGLWDVDDRSTAELMDRLYAGIAEGRSPGQALRQAKLDMIRGGTVYSKPYYWGPFELFALTP